MESILTLIIGSIFVNNYVFAKFLGVCPLLGVSTKVETAAGMGAAVTFVITMASAITYVIYYAILEPLNLVYLETIVFILVFVAYAILVVSKSEAGSLSSSVLTAFTMVNLGFFAFNIIPIPPLDGSRVLYVLAPDFVRSIFDTIERYGVLLIFAIVMVGGSLIVTYMNFIIVNMLKGFSIVFGG